MAMKAAVTTNQVVAVKLKPSLLTAVRKKLKEYTANQLQIRALGHAQDKLKGEIEKLFTDAGEYNTLCDGVRVDDVPLKIICSTQSQLDKKFMIAQGWVSAEQLAEATKTTPKKPYLGITLEKEDKKEEDD